MEKLKSILSIFFIIMGLTFAFLTYSLADKDSHGEIKSFGGRSLRTESGSIAATGSGVDSSNDGVAIGLGIISGFSFLCSTLFLTSVSKKNIS